MDETLCIILPFAVMGAGTFIFTAFLTLREYIISETWKTVTGTVVSSRMTTSRSGRRNAKMMYKPVITYEYFYDGKRRKGESSILSSGNSKEMEMIVDKHEEGKKIELLINPNNPKQTRVKRYVKPIQLAYIVPMAIGLIFLIFAGVMYSTTLETTTSETFFSYVILLFVVFFTFFGVLVGYAIYKKYYRVKKWDTVKAKVISASLGYTGKMYYPDINYEYLYKGKKYSGVYGGYESSDRIEMQAIANKAKNKKTIEIYVNQKDPFESSIKLDKIKKGAGLPSKFIKFGALFGVAAGLVFLIVGGYGFYTSNELMNWTAVNATVKNTNIEWDRTYDGDGDYTDYYTAYIYYNYTHKGKEYSEYDSSTYSDFRSSAKGWIDDHVNKSRVEIFVDPKNPNNSKVEFHHTDFEQRKQSFGQISICGAIVMLITGIGYYLLKGRLK